MLRPVRDDVRRVLPARFHSDRRPHALEGAAGFGPRANRPLIEDLVEPSLVLAIGGKDLALGCQMCVDRVEQRLLRLAPSVSTSLLPQPALR